MKTIDVPGLGVVEFPDTMPDDAIEAVLRAMPQANATPTAADTPMSLRAIGEGFRAAPEALMNLGITSALPTLGGLAGLATAASPIGRIPGAAPLATSLGSVAGVKANELLGLETPTGVDYAVAGGLPLAAAGGRALLERLPGAAGGLQQAAVATAEGLPSRIGVGGADALYNQLRQMNPRIPTAKILDALTDLQAGEATIAKSLKDPMIRKALAGVQQLMHPMPGTTATAIDFTVLHGNMKRIGGMIEQAERRGGDADRVITRLYKSFREALDDAQLVGGTAGDLLAQANQAFRRELAQKDVAAAIGPHISHATGFRQFNADGALDRLSKGRLAEDLADLTKRDPMLAAEVNGIKATLKTLAKVPSIGTSAETGITSSPYAPRKLLGGLIGGVTGGGIGSALGFPGMGAGGGAVGGILATELVSNALMSAPGRAVIAALAQHGYAFDQILNVLAQAARPTMVQAGRNVFSPAAGRR